jgi:hypothetical protein
MAGDGSAASRFAQRNTRICHGVHTDVGGNAVSASRPPTESHDRIGSDELQLRFGGCKLSTIPQSPSVSSWRTGRLELLAPEG